jgi:hypothetical protein
LDKVLFLISIINLINKERIMAGNRFRMLDSWHFGYYAADNATAHAADEIINTPEKHLMTQDEIFWAEGGVLGLAAQAGGIGLGLGLAFTCCPRLPAYLKNGQLRAMEWITLLFAGYLGYNVGHVAGARFFGDAQRLQNHWMAYHYVKTLNRFEGRQILTKKPTY